MTNRTVLSTLLFTAPFAWIALLLFTRFVPPTTALAFIVVFLLLGIALTSTFTPIAYGIGLRFLTSRLYRSTVRHALRQGILLSLVVVLNLILLALHSWNLFTGIIIFGAAVIIEVLSLARK